MRAEQDKVLLTDDQIKTDFKKKNLRGLWHVRLHRSDGHYFCQPIMISKYHVLAIKIHQNLKFKSILKSAKTCH